MKLIDTVIIFALIMAAGALALGFAIHPGSQNVVPAIVLPVAIWGVGRYFKLNWTILVTFALFMLLALTGVLVEIDVILAVVAVVASLALLDLDAFRVRVLQFERIDDESKLIGYHFGRLGLICALSLLLYGATFIINVNLGVWSALLLAIVLFYGLSRAVTYLRRESD